MLDLTLMNINSLLVLSFKNGDKDPTRDSFNEYYVPLLEIKDFNALIDNNSFFNHSSKNKQEAYEKLACMSRNDVYTTRILLDYLYYQNYYKLIRIDLSIQANAAIPQQINFIGELENIKKTKYTLLHKISANNEISGIPDLKIGSNTIEKKPPIKFLGVMLDKHISWSDHIKTVESKLAKNIGLLNRDF